MFRKTGTASSQVKPKGEGRGPSNLKSGEHREKKGDLEGGRKMAYHRPIDSDVGNRSRSNKKKSKGEKEKMGAKKSKLEKMRWERGELWDKYGARRLQRCVKDFSQLRRRLVIDADMREERRTERRGKFLSRWGEPGNEDKSVHFGGETHKPVLSYFRHGKRGNEEWMGTRCRNTSGRGGDRRGRRHCKHKRKPLGKAAQW